MKYGRLLTAVLLALALCIGTFASAESEGGYQAYALGDKIEDFTVTTYDGKTVTLSEVLAEKEAVLINIWATWCGPCRNEFPHMEEAYRKYSDRVEIIALSCEPGDTDDVLAEFASGLGLTFTVGRDTADLAMRFSATAIPTSVMIDRYGTICFRISGSLPDAASFERLFEAFLGEGYTESTLYHDLPPMLPDAASSTEEELNAALNAAGGNLRFTNGTGKYDWPMTVGEKDGRSVAVSSNTGKDGSTARVCTSFEAKAGDALAVTFRISSAAGFDVMQLIINGEAVKSFGGEDGWMTYAYPLQADGVYEAAVTYQNENGYTAGADVLWLDSVELLTGEAAAAALAANPVYPAADEAFVRPVNESARRVVITDPTGMTELYYGDLFYLIPDETAEFELGLPAQYDPETAFAAFNYDGSVCVLADSVADGRYLASSGGDSIDTTGYCDSSVFLYPSLAEAEDAVRLTYFRSEENIDALINSLTVDADGVVQGSWAYAEEPASEKSGAEQAGEADYVVRYVDQDGQAVAGVMCQVCDESTCQVFVSDENGECAFTLAPYAWEIHTLKLPEGYSGDTETIVTAPVEGGEMVFVLTRE